MILLLKYLPATRPWGLPHQVGYPFKTGQRIGHITKDDLRGFLAKCLWGLPHRILRDLKHLPTAGDRSEAKTVSARDTPVGAPH